MNDVENLKKAAELADKLPEGEWIFCWMEVGAMFIIFAEKNKHIFIRGYWTDMRGGWLEQN